MSDDVNEDLKRLLDYSNYPYGDMACIVNHRTGETGVIRYVEGKYVFLPGVGPEPPGGKKFVKKLFNDGWKMRDVAKTEYELNWIKWKQEDLEGLQDDFHWPYWGSQELMICINNRQTGETGY
jgi:hypothetical protein